MRKFRYTGAILALTSVLLAFLITGTLLVTWQQRVMLIELQKAETSAELDLMADAFYESLLKSDYVTIRTFIERWGSVHQEFLLIRATAPNGFVVGEFQRTPGRNARTIELDKTITLDGRLLMTLSLTADLSKADMVVTKLRNQLIAGSVLFTAVLGIVLWRSQRRMALAPLEQEIELRQRAEAALQHAHDGLEILVRERTAELARREEHIRLLLDSTAEGIYGVDTSGNCTFCNPSGLKMLGYGKEEDIIGRNMHSLIHHQRPDGSPYPEQDCRINNAYRKNQGSHDDSESFWRADGTRFPVEYWSYPIASKGAVAGAVVTFFDITDRQKLEAQLIQSQKMEAIGTLAGGVAHDFNNILTAIIGYGSILQRKMDDADPLKTSVVNILESAQRAARLTKSLLTFGRKQALSPMPVDLNSVVRRVEKLLLPLIGEDVELASELSDADLIVQADAGQLEQVLMNLATNARDAMPQGGCFTVRTGQTTFDAEQARIHGVPAAGSFAVLSVSDTGSGMDEATRLKIFEPFFTTKEVGRGTGLGLAIAYGIIRQHNGTISVYSEIGKGTTFIIYLPLLQRPAAEEQLPRSDTSAARGTETILIAEDDKMVLALMRSLLEEYGYRVLEALDGEQAVRVFSENRDRIQLIILDTIMPKMNGKQALSAIKAVHPDVKALFMSGYTADIISRQGLVDRGYDLMQKPIAPMELLARVRKAIDS
ncbi:MAG: ATP-binding protein [Nitrospirota bacterium]